MFTVSRIIFLLSLLQVASGIISRLGQSILLDFEVYYNYSLLLLSGHNPYQQSVPLNYPPSSLLFFMTSTYFPIQIAQAILTFISVVCLLLAGYLLCRMFLKNGLVIFLILAALLQNFPTKFTLTMGQINLIVLLFIILSFISDQRKNQLFSGLFWGFALMIKIIPAPLVLYFLFRRKWQALAAGIITVAITNLAVINLLGNMKTYFFIHLPRLFLHSGSASSLYDQSLRSFFIRTGLNPQISILISLVTVVFLITFATIKYRSSTSVTGDDQKLTDLVFFSSLLSISAISSSFTWQHHLVFLIPGFFAETIYFLKSKSTLRGILLSTSFALVGYHFPDIARPPTDNPFLISHSLMGTLLLIGLLLTHEKKINS